MKQQILVGLVLFLLPIAIDAAVDACRGWRRYRLNDLMTNVTLALLTALAGAAISVVTLAVYAYVHQHHALFELPATAVTSWLLGFLAYDFLYYWAHRAHHRMAWLWAVHEVHHSGEDMNFGLAIRQSSFGEATTWFFFLPMALVGIPMEIYLGVIAIQLIYQYSIHNTFVKPLGWLEKVLVTPSQHRVHHSHNHLYIDKNYGNVLVIWDLLFGSYQPEVREHLPMYGLRHSVRTWNPIAIHFRAGIELLRKVAACGSLLDKVLCFVKEPAWQPRTLRAGNFELHTDEGPSGAFRKYDPPLLAGSIVYCFVQLVVIGCLIVFLLEGFEQMSATSNVVFGGLIISSAWVLGGLLDGKPAYWRWEPIRLAVTGLLSSLVLLMERIVAAPGELAVVALYVIASVIYLRYFRYGSLTENDHKRTERGRAEGNTLASKLE